MIKTENNRPTHRVYAVRKTGGRQNDRETGRIYGREGEARRLPENRIHVTGDTQYRPAGRRNGYGGAYSGLAELDRYGRAPLCCPRIRIHSERETRLSGLARHDSGNLQVRIGA